MTTRRRWISQATALVATTTLLPRAALAQAEAWPKRAFEARSLAEVLKALGATGPALPSSELMLQAPELAEDGALVPVQLSTTLPGVRQLALLVERNPGPLSAVFNLSEAVEPAVSLRVKMQESSKMHALALLADGRAFVATREVKVTAGGCAGGTDPDAVKNPAAIPIKMRAQSAAGKSTVVRALLGHEMESGQRKDDQGRVIPAWHITELGARLNGQPVLGAWWGPSVSRNPFLQFTLKNAKAGDRLALGWVDNRGERRSDETLVG